MKKQHQQWIDKHGPATAQEATSKCKEYTESMKSAFPELTMKAGFYYDPLWEERQHWWLVDEQGEIIDPTVIQFPVQGFVDKANYTPLEQEDRPIGKCLECGELIFPEGYSEQFCSLAHANSFALSLM